MIEELVTTFYEVLWNQWDDTAVHHIRADGDRLASVWVLGDLATLRPQLL